MMTNASRLSNILVPKPWYNSNHNVRMFTEIRYFYLIISAIGIVGDTMSLAVILSNRSMRRTFTNFLLLNQSLIDLATAVMVMLMITSKRLTPDMNGIQGHLKCFLWISDFPFWSLITSSSYNLMAIALERYLFVVHPLIYRCKLTKTHLQMVAVCAWFSGPVVQLVMLLPTSDIVEGICVTWEVFPSQHCWQMKVYGVYEFCISFLIPVGGIIFFCAKIFNIVNTQIHPESQFNCNTAVQINSRGRRNILNILLSIVLCFIVCNIARSSTYLMFNFGFQDIFSDKFFQYATLIAFSNSCVNPFVYTLQYEAFQAALRQVYARMKSCVTKDSSSFDVNGALSKVESSPNNTVQEDD